MLFLYLTGGTYWAIIQDTVAGGRIGNVSGFVHALANCAGIIGASVTGDDGASHNALEPVRLKVRRRRRHGALAPTG